MNTILNWLDSHPKTTFWSKFVLWALLSCVIPFILIAYRFDLFKTVSKLSVSGWGILAVILVAVFAFTVIRYIKLAFANQYSLFGQVLSGVCKIILPLVATYLILDNIKENLQSFLNVLGIVILCEFVAIPLNPLPKWAYEMQKDLRAEERKETFDYLLDGFFNRSKEKDGE